MQRGYLLVMSRQAIIIQHCSYPLLLQLATSLLWFSVTLLIKLISNVNVCPSLLGV